MCSKFLKAIVNQIKIQFSHLAITRGKMHLFLGMSITFCNDGNFEIDQKKHVLKPIDDFDEDVSQEVSSTSTSSSLKVNPTLKELRTCNSSDFCHASAKLLCKMQRVYPNIETAVSFVCSRPSTSSEDDRSIKLSTKLVLLINLLKANYLLDEKFQLLGYYCCLRNQVV